MHVTLPLASIASFSTAYAQSDFFGKLIILSLVALSIVCWVVLIYKIWITRQIRQISIAFQQVYQQNKEQLLNMEIHSLPHPRKSQVPHPFAQIFSELKTKTIEILNKNLYFATQQSGKEHAQVYLSPTDLEILETHVLTTISAQKKSLEKNLFVLPTIVTLAPFLGLLGTAWGILITLSELHSGGAVSSNAAVLGGISTALATTVMGLIIAIPAIIAYNYLRSTITHYTSDMEDFLYKLLSSIELQYRKVE
ncbi:MAG: MotA/TolQ/ExbB proton channel family protein [Rhabdochlamydiaceae bacterium]|nr:MotA/TolQ/ExbB proton channel family protein [Rhabdochlamydiaceae bacterium]